MKARAHAVQLWRLLRKAGRLSWRERWDAARAVGLLILAEVAVRTLRLPTAAKLFGVRMGTPPSHHRWRQDAVSPLTARQHDLADAILAVGRRWPLSNGACLRESLAIGATIREHEPWLQIGVQKVDGEIGAHAWLIVDGTVVGTRGEFSELTMGQIPA